MTTSHIIYIIDDDLDDQGFLIEAIREINVSFQCFTALNGQEGLQRLESIPFPSIIFLDLNMPRIDGRKFLSAIKKHPTFKSIPVVIYSTSVNEKDKDDVMNLGAADYLVKQPDFSSSKDNLVRIISTYLMVKECPEL